MLRKRVIPSLLLRNGGLVKGEKFKSHKYVGDPINAVRIFNEKEVDELVFFDISVSDKGEEPNYKLIEDIASEAFMPFAYGGGIYRLEQADRLFKLGVEKVVLNTAVYENPNLVTEISEKYGSQSVTVSIDVRNGFLGGHEVVVRNGTQKTKQHPVDYAKRVVALGAGEILLTFIDREGTAKGVDKRLGEEVVKAVNVPVVLQGGLGCIDDVVTAFQETGASAVAAGRMCVFHGKHKAVLITYPKYEQLEKRLAGV
jgi:cyclase